MINASDRDTHAFIEACEATGVLRVADYYGPSDIEVAPLQLSIRNGRRWSTAAGYPNPIKNRANLRILTGAIIDKLILAAIAVSACSIGG